MEITYDFKITTGPPKNQMLKSINLSLSSACGGNCIFCPENRGKRIKQKIMPFEHVKKIIDEISSEDFKKDHNVTWIEVGENGDAFLNKDIIKILRLIKSSLPNVTVGLFTNFQNFTKDKAEIILKEHLIDSLWCNIDGSTKEIYFNVKGLDLDNTMRNLTDFLGIRNKMNSNLGIRILILSLHRYIHTIYNNFNFYPSKLKDDSLTKISDDSGIIKRHLDKILDYPKDCVFLQKILGWAERDKIDTKSLNYDGYSCPNLNRIKSEAFIAPDGTWYACCYDSNNELILGNVIDQSINEIFSSEKRKKLIELLSKKRFSKIVGPCKTVNCCQEFIK